MHELGEMKRAQELRVNEVSVQNFTENHETIQKLTSQLQELQGQMNSMSDSGDFYEVELTYSARLSYVSSQLAMIPSSRSMLSRDKRLPLDTWNTSGLQENVFGSQFSTFDSPGDHPQRIQSCTSQRERGSVPQVTRTRTLITRDDKQNTGTIPMTTFAGRPSTMSSLLPVEFPQNSIVGQQRQQISELQFDKFPSPQSFFVRKKRFTNQVTTCSDFLSNAMLWIKEVKKVDSLEELKSSYGKNFPNFEMLDAKTASALNKIIQNSQFKKKVRLEEQKAHKEDRFLRGRQIAFMIYDYCRVIGAHDTALDYVDLFSVTLHDTRWNKVLLSISKISSDDILERVYTLRIRESVQLKTLLELYDMEIHQKISVPNYCYEMRNRLYDGMSRFFSKKTL